MTDSFKSDSREVHPLEVALASRSGVELTPGPLPSLGKILLVEDDANLVAGLSRRLRRAGYDVLSTGDGARGLELAMLQDPDLVLLDLGLPGMRGFKVLHELRALLPMLPVVIITGDHDQATSARAANSGVSRVFHKPFRTTRLVRTIAELLM